MEYIKGLGIANVILLLGVVAIFHRIWFFSLLKKRHCDIWKDVNSPSTLREKIGNQSTFLKEKTYKDFDDSQLRSIGNRTNFITSTFMWGFGIFLIYLFVAPLIKVILK